MGFNATLVPISLKGLALAGSQLRQGGLVAFPTETVFGLGANALNKDAVLSIFKAKGRPLTDPVIVHVCTMDDALHLVDLDTKGRALFMEIANRFWPGPLTLIAKAAKHVPLCVSAGTGFVGIRYPGHPVAQRLLAEAKVPVAAPSANRFGHVSPTESSHVWKDLCMESISILDDTQIFSEELELSPESTASCAIGIESTVVKLLPSTNEVLILRHGGVSESALKELPSLTVRNIFSKTQNSSDNIHAHSAPGQLISHYAPDVTAYLVQDLNTVTTNDSNMVATKDSISSAVIIDFMGQLLKHKDNCLSYMDLSPSGNVSEAAAMVYHALRWAEQVPQAKSIYLSDVMQSNHENKLALHDRLYRASSGKSIRL